MPSQPASAATRGPERFWAEGKEGLVRGRPAREREAAAAPSGDVRDLVVVFLDFQRVVNR